MTTINNSENLIEKVGGIEKAREIVNGAPKGFDAYSFKEKKYVRSDWFLGEVSLNDLRTAIAEHDEFKVGDLVVSTLDGQEFWMNCICKIEAFHKKMAITSCGGHSIHHYEFRHATPEEIKAGQRLEAERHG
ncbi:MAG: hypothetical protein L0G09_14050 [Acinetobacter sp.]|nr:hypothetical protein [Acinetobacter sp.]MDN5433468.1 hypothetical protein [Acinetobacter sp.]MDN5622728.1 hypothetical protein [Acinetobacter sp.]MDN5650917.1 hypothetical protein [Acinetobacter sp.]MDN5690926.1 hypothetical protein [Acinetobacter sp.]